MSRENTHCRCGRFETRAVSDYYANSKRHQSHLADARIGKNAFGMNLLNTNSHAIKRAE